MFLTFVQTTHLKIDIGGMSLVAQWLGRCAPIGLPLQGAGWGTKNPHVVWYGPKIKKIHCQNAFYYII